MLDIDMQEKTAQLHWLSIAAEKRKTNTLYVLWAVPKALQDLERACARLQGLHEAVEPVSAPVVQHDTHRAYHVALRKFHWVSVHLLQVHSKVVVVCCPYEAGLAAERGSPYAAIRRPSHKPRLQSDSYFLDISRCGPLRG